MKLRIQVENNLRYGTKLDASGFEDWIKINLGISQRYTAPLNYRADFKDVATFQFEAMSTSRLQGALSLAKVFLPHLAKVTELTRPFSLLQSRFNAVLSVLDRFHLGVFILTDDGSIVLQNLAATRIIDQSDGLLVDNKNRLYSRNAESNTKLQTAIPHVQLCSDGKKNHYSKQFSVARSKNSTPYFVEISALRSQDIEISGGFKGVLAIVIDPDYHAIIDTGGLAQLFGFTDAEQKVCRLLVEGHTTGEIADSRNTSIETVRGQIKTPLSKTKTSQRAGLVKLALSINLPVDTNN